MKELELPKIMAEFASLHPPLKWPAILFGRLALLEAISELRKEFENIQFETVYESKKL